MNERTYRRLIIGLLGALVVIIGLVALASPSGEGADLPEPIEALFPLPGDTVVRQAAIEVDLPVGYTLELEVDGVRIPPQEIGVTPATGRFIWQPGPSSVLATWESGEHSIVIRWERLQGAVADIGTFTWTFRVT
jgi:hypothetical protein